MKTHGNALKKQPKHAKATAKTKHHFETQKHEKRMEKKNLNVYPTCNQNIKKNSKFFKLHKMLHENLKLLKIRIIQKN